MAYESDISVVIDAGSQTLKAGFAGEPSPRAVIPATVGRFRNPVLEDGIPLVYCGHEAIRNRGLSNLISPIQDGRIDDWDEMEKLWFHVFYKELHVPPESIRVLHSVHPLATESDKERMAEIFFECFAVDGLYMTSSPHLALYASGRTSGIVWENGYSCCHAAPVFEGFPLKNACVTSPLSGKLLTQNLQKLLANMGYSFTTPFEVDLLDKIKKDMCYVSKEFETELAKTAGFYESRVTYTLPDGQNILLGDERFVCPEVLFQPSLGGLDCKNIVDTICTSAGLCDLDHRKMFFNNIIISGGSSMFPGLPERLRTELAKKVKQTDPEVTVQIDAMSTRQYASWAGGSILGSLSNMNGFWMTKEQYEDTGAEHVRYKFF